MSFVNVKRALASSLVLAGAGAGCGSVDGVQPPVNATTAGTVDEGGTLSLNGTLVTADPDSDAAELVYTVESLPANGALMKDGAAIAVGDTFTQKDVNDGKVSYVNDGAEKTSDAFTWSLSDANNELGPLDYAITITPVNDVPLVVNNTGGNLAEGGNVVLTADQLTATDVETPTPLTYTVVAITHGVLEQRVGAAPFAGISAGATFTQQDIADGNIKFTDSGVDDANLAAQQSTTAGFSWSVADADGGVTEGATTFTVTPVDDPAAMTWKSFTCYVPNVVNAANPVMALADPDDATSAYQICVSSFINGSYVSCPTGVTTGSQCVTNSVTPTVKNGSTVLAAGACVPYAAIGNITLTNTIADGGGVYWQLKKGTVDVGAAQNVYTGACP